MRKGLEKGLCRVDGVVAVHELHIWAITVGKVLPSCHTTITRDADADLVLDKLVGYIRTAYNISHVTIQIEQSASCEDLSAANEHSDMKKRSFSVVELLFNHAHI
ncbi:Metal tolerance protein 1 [Asimina triloba]